MFTGVLELVPGYLSILLTSAAQARTGHRSLLWTALCCVMHVSFSPFFWSSMVMEIQSVDDRVFSDDV